MDYVKWLKHLEAALYGLALAVAIVLAGYSFLLVLDGVMSLTKASSEHYIYSILGNLFLFIIFIELIDTFITYIQNKEVIVYKIIDVALVALAREIIVYMSPVNSQFDTTHAGVLIASALVLGIVDYLQHKRSA